MPEPVLPTRARAQSLADRWTDLWASDPGAMVRGVYAPDTVVELAGHGPAATVRGHDELLAAEAVLLERIPDHRNRVLRILVSGDGRQAVLESVVTGTSAGDDGAQAAPCCVWWWLDGDGRVAREVAYWEWPERRADEGAAAGTLVAGDGRQRAPERYRWIADRMAALWSTDPVRMVDEMYATTCVVENLRSGRAGTIWGADALRAAEATLLEVLPLPDRRLRVVDLLGDGDRLALAVTIEGRQRGTGPLRRSHGTVVLTLDGEDDRIVSDRIHWSWRRARETAP